MRVMTRRQEDLLDRLRALAGGDGRIVRDALYAANAECAATPTVADVVRRILIANRVRHEEECLR